MSTGNPDSSGVVRKNTTSTAGSTLSQLYSRMPSIIKKAGYADVWGVDFDEATERTRNTPRTIVLQKFLAANKNNVAKAEDQLIKALKWRRNTHPHAKLQKVFDEDVFGGMGKVTAHRISRAGCRIAIIWNTYGTLTDTKRTLKKAHDYDDYMIALMELAIEALDLKSVAAPPPNSGPDNFKIIQVHDCKGANRWKTCHRIKSSLESVMPVLQNYYPGLLEHHLFVNVGSMHDFGMKFFNAVVPEKCQGIIGSEIGKFRSCKNHRELINRLAANCNDTAAFEATLPVEYGGTGPSVQLGRSLNLQSLASRDKNAPATEASQGENLGAVKGSDDPNTLDELIADAAAKGSKQQSDDRGPTVATKLVRLN